MTFDEIFDLDKTRDRSLLGATDAQPLTGELDAVVGKRRESRTASAAGHDASRLVALVDAAAADRLPTTAAPAPWSVAMKRTPRRVDWMSVVAGSLAVVAVAVASTLTAVQIATASPASDAVVLLESDEEALAADEQALTFAAARLGQQVQTGQERATAVQTTIATLQPDAEEAPFVSADALAALQNAATQHQAVLAATAAPAALPAWKASDVDESSLASVASRIDEVRARSGLVEAANADLRVVRAEVDAADDAFATALAAFAAALAGATAAELEASPDPAQALRDAVQPAGSRVAAADLASVDGEAAAREYRDSVRALRAEQLRMAIERENNQQGSRTGTSRPRTQTPVPEQPAQPVAPSIPPVAPPETTDPDAPPAG